MLSTLVLWTTSNTWTSFGPFSTTKTRYRRTGQEHGIPCLLLVAHLVQEVTKEEGGTQTVNITTRLLLQNAGRHRRNSRQWQEGKGGCRCHQHKEKRPATVQEYKDFSCFLFQRAAVVLNPARMILLILKKNLGKEAATGALCCQKCCKDPDASAGQHMVIAVPLRTISYSRLHISSALAKQ